MYFANIKGIDIDEDVKYLAIFREEYSCELFKAKIETDKPFVPGKLSVIAEKKVYMKEDGDFVFLDNNLTIVGIRYDGNDIACESDIFPGDEWRSGYALFDIARNHVCPPQKELQTEYFR